MTKPTLFLALMVSTAFAANAGEVFQDCPECPEMISVSAGTFQMGDLSGQGDEDEIPVHEVKIEHTFAIGRYEVTFDQWDACVADGGCDSYVPGDEGWGRANRPVINVNAANADTYIEWLSKKTGETYRLPSEAEWEYSARGGTTMDFSWGNEVGEGNAVCLGCGSEWDEKSTAPVGSFAPNSFGLYDVHGNVHEWTADCWSSTYDGAPADGSPRVMPDCTKRSIRSGTWDHSPFIIRSSNRGGGALPVRGPNLGFRVARDL